MTESARRNPVTDEAKLEYRRDREASIAAVLRIIEQCREGFQAERAVSVGLTRSSVDTSAALMTLGASTSRVLEMMRDGDRRIAGVLESAGKAQEIFLDRNARGLGVPR